jgi:predicted alpha/beta hydrolase family esterase
MQGATVLVLPGWQGCEPDHWQMHWVRQHGDTLVEQNDWMRPRRGDWLARLDEVVIDTPGDLLLAAHGLGCLQVAAWAAFSRHTARVCGALLVAPIDIDAPALKNTVFGWAPALRARLPFASTVVVPPMAPFSSRDHAQGLAGDWGAKWVESVHVAPLGADSFRGDWPQGRALMQTFLKD